MTKFRSLLLASLLGGLAIHGALVACSGSGNAGAQTSSCQHWAIFDVSTNVLSPGPTVASGATALYHTPVQAYLAPAGWEPIGGVTNEYIFRKCMP